ncbi:MAG: hypothetical protein LBD14_06375 [Puniceicoccales bacterium]|nr:hypothetical protein [Puniceicoccales bacterium]
MISRECKLYWVSAVLSFMFILCGMCFISTTVVPGGNAGGGLGELKE